MQDDNDKAEVIHTKIWQEKASADNPFVADKCFCSGYDVYGELLNKASWFEYIWLLFKLEKPQKWQVKLFEKIAIAIANPGIRDYSVRAAMNAGVGGSTSASTLMAALAVGAGQLCGARDVYSAVLNWEECKYDLTKWCTAIGNLKNKEVDGWPEKEHPSGFDPNSSICAKPVIQTLDLCASIDGADSAKWLYMNRGKLEETAGMPIAMTAVIGAVFYDLQFNADQSEMVCLILRLPGTAAHALEQKELGWKKYPFYLDKYVIK
tara:strand:+ start:14184 stop:14975 length:792 start_codon:yes stop_codon:yes gene_type:complete